MDIAKEARRRNLEIGMFEVEPNITIGHYLNRVDCLRINREFCPVIYLYIPLGNLMLIRQQTNNIWDTKWTQLYFFIINKRDIVELGHLY